VDVALKEKLEVLRLRVDSGIDSLLPASEVKPHRLHEAMRYSLEAGGKRLRPALLILASELFPSREDPLPAAVAIECLHTYTLIHDDLPAVDNSDLRRGRPSCHKRFDEATALLAGDALLTYAFELLATSYEHSPALVTGLVRDLATSSGSRQLIGGQMEDVRNEGKPISPELLHYIHENKTAALITAALTMGLRFSEPTPERIRLIRIAGRELGLAFQIIDDILDATSDQNTMGKPVGSDAEVEKCTYVAHYGIETARNKAEEHTCAAIDACRKIGGQNELLIQLIATMGRRVN